MVYSVHTYLLSTEVCKLVPHGWFIIDSVVALLVHIQFDPAHFWVYLNLHWNIYVVLFMIFSFHNDSLPMRIWVILILNLLFAAFCFNKISFHDSLFFKEQVIQNNGIFELRFDVSVSGSRILKAACPFPIHLYSLPHSASHMSSPIIWCCCSSYKIPILKWLPTGHQLMIKTKRRKESAGVLLLWNNVIQHFDIAQVLNLIHSFVQQSRQTN